MEETKAPYLSLDAFVAGGRETRILLSGGWQSSSEAADEGYIDEALLAQRQS